MITLTKSQVPESLKVGGFYSSLEDDDREFNIPLGCFKADWEIANDADFALVLCTLQYWMIPIIPYSVIRYAAWHRPKEVISALPPFREDVPYLKFLEALCKEVYRSGEGTKRKVLRKSKHLHNDTARLCCMQYEQQAGNVWDTETCALAASFKRMDVVKFLHENGCPWNQTTCYHAALANSLECLVYAHENGCPWDSHVCVAATITNSLPCLQYAHKHGCKFGNAYLYVYSLNTACAKYIVKHGGRVLTAKHCADAAARRSLHQLSRLRLDGCPWDVTTCREAARVNAVELLRYAHEHGCPLDESGMLAAAANSLDCLRYMHDTGYPWNDRVCAAAAEAGELACLSYAHGQGCPWTTNTCAAAASAGQIDCLKYARDNGCPWDADAVNGAARNGHVACLRFALNRGCPTNADTCVNAVEGGKHCLALVRHHGCEWDARCCAAAVRVDSRQCLELLLQNGCPYDDDLVRIAVREGSRSCLGYLHEHDFSWDGDVAFIAVTAGSLACLQYLHGHGCQWEAAALLQVPINIKTRKCLEYVQAHPYPAV
jgi:hypothetical protein